MNPLHLIWIIPLSVSFGFVLCSIFTVGKQYDKECGQ